ncbi:hypothetical protein SLS53_002787 [Cytospora paraplurivora]|uniref:G-patch domain-containing protein n=1 Tax=Cytospora paraplurivora TaxID=2898453 RepID=A0AAN9UE36_9PEZI
MRHFNGRPDNPIRQFSLDDDDDDDKDDEPPAAFRPSLLREDSNGETNQDVDGGKQEGEEEGEEEDDYMNMTFTDVAPAQPETSLQRRERLRREGLQRGRVPSKAELAAQERQRREEGLARPLIPSGAAAAAAKKSKGLAMMAKMGFRPGSALGSGGGPAARSEPLRIEVKEDRGGIGADAERKRKVQEAAGAAGLAKRARVEEVGDYRERMAREREAARKEKLVFAAQKIAEMMDEESGGGDGGDVLVDEGAAEQDGDGDGDGEEKRKKKKNKKKKKGGKTPASRPLKSVPVLYRGLVRQREEKERDRRMRYDLEQSSGGLSAKLPTYEEDDSVLDNDDRIALGRTEKRTVYMPADDLDEEDPELDEFMGLDAGERLERIVKYLRGKYRYCFWCKCAYPDEEMEGCPGLTEEDHD